jgi:broad specificity phosphatase PhoE
MGEIILIRHGQANGAARSEDEYDRLSDHGHQQARWLGEWMRDHEAPFDRVLSGTMRRHRETAAGLGVTAEEDTRLNEINYFVLTDQMQNDFDLPRPDKESWHSHMVATFANWKDGRISGAEPYSAYESRVGAVLAEAAAPGRRVLCVTSGGIIGMAVRLALGLPVDRLPDVLLPVGHTSVTRLQVRPEGLLLYAFNAYPHFERDGRLPSRTWF